jgi:peptide/nickel transport system substrate-binding protein
MRAPADRKAKYAPAGAGIAVAVLAAAALAACGGGGGSTAPTATSGPQAKVFIDLLEALPRSLDPADELGPAFDRLESSLASTLVRPAGRPASSATLAPPQDVDGLLASSWAELGNGDYVFELRHGVQSAYGHELGARDVQFSFTRELARSGTARFLARAAKIALHDPITVLGPLRVRVNVTAPGALTLGILGDFHFGVLDSRAVRAHATRSDPSAHGWLAGHLAFYGAYALSEFDPVRKLLLHASPRTDASPAFGTLAIEAVPSATARVSDLGAAAASHTRELDWTSFQAAARTNGVRAQTPPATTVATLVPNERFTPFASVLVRRAVSLAIDRAAISRAAFAGFARPARHPVPSTIALPAGVVQPTYAHDLVLARGLLARAGYPHGFTVALAVNPSDGPEIAAEAAAVAGELHRVGVTVRARRVGSAGEAARLARAGTVAAVLESADAPIASASFEIVANYLRHSPGNIEGYDSPALDALAGPLTTTAAGSAANAAAQQRALTIVASTFPVIPLVEIPSQNVTLAGIRGYAAYASQATYYDQLTR